MGRALALIVLTAGCGDPLAPSSCLDLADWQVALDHGGRPQATLALTSDGLVVAIGDAGMDVTLGSHKVRGAQLLRLAADGTELALVPAPEGDGMTGPAGLHVDDHDNSYVAWTGADRTIVASYAPDLQRRWSYELTAQQALSFDADSYGYSALLAKDRDLPERDVYYIEPDGRVRWSTSVENENATQLVIASNEDVFTWQLSPGGSLRFRHDQFNGTEVGVLAYDTTPSFLYRDGGYVSSDGSHLARVGSAGDELWSRDFEANIGAPIATASGDVLLPAATGADSELPFVIVVIDGAMGYTKAARARCARTILWAADDSSYFGIGDGGDHPGSIARFPLR